MTTDFITSTAAQGQSHFSRLSSLMLHFYEPARMNYEWVLNLWRASLNLEVAATIPPATGAPVVLPSNGILAGDERLGTKCTILFRFVFCHVRREIWWEVTGSHRPASGTPLIAACALEESFNRWLAWIWILVSPLWSSFRVRLIT